MMLSKWLETEEMTDAEFARVSGVGQRALIGKYRRGLLFPSPQNLLRIRSATGGQVTADDFVDQYAQAGGDRPVSNSPHIGRSAA